MEVCSQNSIARALLDMVIQGLDVGQKQCYFIVRGNELTLLRSYFGAQTVLRRIEGVKDVWATVVYEGDKIEVSVIDGKRVVTNHDTDFGNEDNPIIGAYAVVELQDGTKNYTIMTKKEIDECWKKSSSTQHTVHKEYPQEMAKRTVLNRACKNYVNTDTKNSTLAKSIIETTANEYDVEEINEPENLLISKEQVLEIATLIGDDAEKAEILYNYGYETINDIKQEDFNLILEDLKGEK